MLPNIFRERFFRYSGFFWKFQDIRSSRFSRTFKNFQVIFEARRKFIRSNCLKTSKSIERPSLPMVDVAGARKARTGLQAWIQPVSHRSRSRQVRYNRPAYAAEIARRRPIWLTDPYRWKLNVQRFRFQLNILRTE